jgi:hypothetical protein
MHLLCFARIIQFRQDLTEIAQGGSHARFVCRLGLLENAQRAPVEGRGFLKPPQVPEYDPYLVQGDCGVRVILRQDAFADRQRTPVRLLGLVQPPERPQRYTKIVKAQRCQSVVLTEELLG